MSVKVQNLVMQLGALGDPNKRSSNGSSKRFVLWVLADMADDAGYCWPSADEIARRTELGRSTVFRLIKELETEDKILKRAHRTRKDGGYTSNAYRIQLDVLRTMQRDPEELKQHEREHVLDELFRDDS